MTTTIDRREDIVAALKGIDSRPLPDAAQSFFATLGYQSDRRLPIATAQQFCEQLDPTGQLTDREQEDLNQLKALNLLFQLTDAELGAQAGLFDDPSLVQDSRIESYLFFAAELPSEQYTRTALARLVRAINKPLPMPALVLFRHGDRVSIGIIHRRLHKRDRAKDVLEKVTLIKDIACDDPIRAHVEILNDLLLANLDAEYGVSNFVRLHDAWTKRLDSYALSDKFYLEIADWYFWAHHLVEAGGIRLPQHCDNEQKKSLFLIRLLTRVIFCWFLVEKRLIPADLFREHRLGDLIKDFHPKQSPELPDNAPTFYRAILQNLFFGTLNMPPDQRAFRKRKKEGERYDKNYGITNLWRHKDAFHNPDEWMKIAQRIPFLNGGLFDCLDDKAGRKKDMLILDGFSDREDLGCHVPNDLFFGSERIVDLSHDYGEEGKRTARSKKAKVRGLIEILSRYKFTIEENTPLENEIALDPELLGKVFENLLASYNEDTRTTARKALGAFYTPREIVSYMVDEALKSYLSTQVPRSKGALDDLFSNKATLNEIIPKTRDALIAAIGHVKILDPACGSGAFPMGALHRLVDLLQKLDPNNESWKRDRLAETRRYQTFLEKTGAGDEKMSECDDRIRDIERSFDTRYHELDFARKLYLIENCIYGVDIQPIATQIAKLRVFISLVVDQKTDMKAPNLGVRPLPNLETRLVAADTLIPIEKTKIDLFSSEIDNLRVELSNIRHEHFNARNPAAKRKWREADEEKRQEIALALQKSHALSIEGAQQLASWNPYDQNAAASFFDPEWMFGLPVGKVHIEATSSATLLGRFAFVNEVAGQTELIASVEKEIESGFDIVIGNPPYVRQEKIKHLKPILGPNYPSTYTGTADLYVYFYARALQLLRTSGVIAYITSNSFLTSAFGEKLRTHLSTSTTIHVLIDFAEARVFAAITEPCIFIAKKERSNNSSFRALRWDSQKHPDNVREEFAANAFSVPQESLGKSPWQLEAPRIRQALAMLVSTGTPLGEFIGNRFYRGLLTGLNEAFIVDQLKRDEIARDERSAGYLKPLLRGRDLRPWKPQFGGQWLIGIPSSENVRHPWSGLSETEAERTFKCKLPTIYKHFFPFRDKLISRGDKGHYYWELRSCAYYQEFAKPKIIYQDIARYFGMAWDDSGALLANTCYFIPEAVKWMLGILLSSSMQFYVKKTLGSDRGGFIRLFSIHVEKFPIPTVSASQQDIVEIFVNYMLFLTTHFKDSKEYLQDTRASMMLAYWERVLNGLVYELYFPEEVHESGLLLFDLVAQAQLPDIQTIPDVERLPHLRKLLETLHSANHPLRIALDKLQTLDTVRIIEGKA